MARFYRSRNTRPISTFVPLPLDFLQQKLSRRQRRRDDIEAALEEDRRLKINSIAKTRGSEDKTADRILHEQLLKEAADKEKAVQDILMSPSDDLAGAERGLKNINKWYRQQMDPTGLAYNINQRYKEKAAADKEIIDSDLYKKDKDYLLYLNDENYRKQGYIGEGGIDAAWDEYGYYGKETLPIISKRRDLAQKIAKSAEARAEEHGYTYHGNGIWQDRRTKTTKKTKDFITELLSEGLIQDEAYKEYTEFMINRNAFNLKNYYMTPKGGGLSEKDAETKSQKYRTYNRQALYSGYKNFKSIDKNTIHGELIDYAANAYEKDDYSRVTKDRTDPTHDYDFGVSKSSMRDFYKMEFGSSDYKISSEDLRDEIDELNNKVYAAESNVEKAKIGNYNSEIAKEELHAAKRALYYRERLMENAIGVNKSEVNKYTRSINEALVAIDPSLKMNDAILKSLLMTDPSRAKKYLIRDIIMYKSTASSSKEHLRENSKKAKKAIEDSGIDSYIEKYGGKLKEDITIAYPAVGVTGSNKTLMNEATDKYAKLFINAGKAYTPYGKEVPVPTNAKFTYNAENTMGENTMIMTYKTGKVDKYGNPETAFQVISKEGSFAEEDKSIARNAAANIKANKSLTIGNRNNKLKFFRTFYINEDISKSFEDQKVYALNPGENFSMPITINGARSSIPFKVVGGNAWKAWIPVDLITGEEILEKRTGNHQYLENKGDLAGYLEKYYSGTDKYPGDKDFKILK